MLQLHLAFELYPLNFIENVTYGKKDPFGTKFRNKSFVGPFIKI